MSVHPIEVRNLRFPLDAQIPKNWFGEPVVTTFFDNLSVFFPRGERFFMTAVRAFEGQLTDEVLKEDVRRFYQQEALHSREHTRYNDMLRAHGYPIDAMDQSVRKLLERVAKLRPEVQLAVTCSLEHFTALLAQLMLGADDPFHQAHPLMSALWRWHAAEENEHAAVAFDVFQKVSGSYRLRISAMLFATLIFWAKVAEQQVHMMRADGSAASLPEWRKLARFLFRKPGWLLKIVRPYLAYYKPSFHPSQLDSSHLLERWREDFEQLEIYRQSLKPTARLANAP